MYPDYADIRERIPDEPKWWDANGVPRYCDPHPDDCSDIYADEVAFVEIDCQSCRKRFLVEFVWGIHERALDPRHLPLSERASDLFYGDPPYHEFEKQCSGSTMTSDSFRVVTFWKRNRDCEWVKVPELSNLPITGEVPATDRAERSPAGATSPQTQNSRVSGKEGTANHASD